jgi:protein-tyrosine-phosphatase
MAEGFARAYGADVIIPASAGLAPAMSVAADTIRAMDEKEVDIRHHFPKSWRHVGKTNFDLVVNMSGYHTPEQFETVVRAWDVPDPIALDYPAHCRVRDSIEALVMDLILELRSEHNQQHA